MMLASSQPSPTSSPTRPLDADVTSERPAASARGPSEGSSPTGGGASVSLLFIFWLGRFVTGGCLEGLEYMIRCKWGV